MTGRLATGLAVAAFATANPASAQGTTLYAYDALGRLTTSGRTSSDTTLYTFDTASNRTATRCCEAIGGWQVKTDGFDPYFYLQTYPDIRAAGIDPYTHWLDFGAAENRLPNRYFDTAWYRQTYGLASGVNPLTEYHTTGWTLGRNPSLAFSTTGYHQAYPDTSSIDPLWHLLRFGYAEGRSAVPVP